MADQLSILQQLNNEIDILISKKQLNNPKLKQNMLRIKGIIYSNGNIANENENYLREALRFAQTNLLYSLSLRSNHQLQLAIENIRFFYENNLPQGKQKNHSIITAINLLFLLSSHRNEQFYCKLESLAIDDLKDPYIAYVFLLNQAIEEGNYRRVFQLKKQNPSEYFQSFLERIQSTVRTEIAKSAEKAYSTLTISQALQIFQLDNPQQMRKFINRYLQSMEQPLIHWKINGEMIHFEKDDKNKIKFNSDQLISTTLNYAHQLEKIA